MKFSLNEIIEATGAEVSESLPCAGQTEELFEISTDTRTIKSGDLYLPLKGATFDGEDFCDKALDAGASGCFYTKEAARQLGSYAAKFGQTPSPDGEGWDGVILSDNCENSQEQQLDTDLLPHHPIALSSENNHTSIPPYLHTSKLWLKVPDTLTAYLQIANFARKKINPIVIGVTGSSGKTTTKEMIYSVVSEKFKTQKTFSNHNNEIGFCQTVLGMEDDCEVLIVEMGMRGLGEIELITKYAEPDYAVITNTGSAHIGRLGSLDNIAKAKCEITHGLKKALIAHDNERIKKFADFEGEKVFYSLKDVEILEKAKGYSKFIYKTPSGTSCHLPQEGGVFELNVEGDYNIENSLSAIEIGLHLGMTYEEIKSGLAKYKPIEKRWECENVGGYNIINDSYNANPESMKASVSTFLELYPNSVVILGNMGELGENEVEFHREVGKHIAEQFVKIPKNFEDKKVGGLEGRLFNKSNLSKSTQAQHHNNSLPSYPPTFLSSKTPSCPLVLRTSFITVGNLAIHIGEELEKQGFSVKHFDNNIETSRYILENVDVGTTIFLKASRSMKFEEIIENLKNGVN